MEGLKQGTIITTRWPRLSDIDLVAEYQGTIGHRAMPNRENKTVTKAQWIQHLMSYPCLLPLKDAAAWLGLAFWAMRKRTWAGQIRLVKFPDSRKMFIDIQDLVTFIQDNKTTIK